MMCTQEFLRAGLLFPSKTLFCVLPASHRIFDLFLHSTDSICMSGHDYVSSKFPFDPNHSDALFVDVWIPHYISLFYSVGPSYAIASLHIFSFSFFPSVAKATNLIEFLGF